MIIYLIHLTHYIVTSVVTDPTKNFWRSLISSTALVTSLLYAVDRVGMFQENSEFLTTGKHYDDNDGDGELWCW